MIEMSEAEGNAALRVEEQEQVGNEQQEAEKDAGHDGLNYGDWNGVDIMKSLCMRCGAEGETRLMLHKIPHFRELVIASFYCEECGERNNEVTFGGEIQLQGCIYGLKVTHPKDLNRQIIKSDSASLRIREIDFEIPPHTQKGEINTLEGVLKTAAKNLSLYQHERLMGNPEVGLRYSCITPYTIHHTPYTIYRIPYTIYHTPYTIHHIPYTIYHIPYTIHHI
ncbi:hypothetical protein EON63_24930, partial [archaeon]